MSNNSIIKKDSKKKEISIEDQYKRKSLRQHILDLPDSYIGSIQVDKIKIHGYNDNEEKITISDKEIVLGLYKIFDEILVNAADNTVRDKKCNSIKTNIDIDTGIIEVSNNGSTIPIELHKEENMYVPEMVFGNLLTSGNYDKKGKTVGGKNGYGAKCANIYSLWFDIEIYDTIRKKKYYQRFKNNMSEKEEPVITDITKTSKESYTKITFLPDYKRFGLTNLTKDMESLLKRRVYDIAGTTSSNVKVYYNDVLLDIKSFEEQYPEQTDRVNKDFDII